MSEQGVFAVHRGVFEHPVFAPEPFTEREAWLWLISSACWKAKRIRVGRKMIDLERGQLAFSERFLAERFRWSKTKVRRTMRRFESEAMVSLVTDRDATRVTICNYDKYAFDRTTDEPQSGPQTGPQKNHRRTKEEEGKKDNISIELRFPEFWAEYPKREGGNPRKPALQAYLQGVKAGHAEQEIIDGAKRYRASVRRSGKEGTQYVAQAQTWLRQARWSDDAATAKTIFIPPEINWEAKMRQYVALPEYSRAWYGPGSPPGRPGCGVPAEVQRKYGFEPATPTPVEGAA